MKDTKLLDHNLIEEANERPTDDFSVESQIDSLKKIELPFAKSKVETYNYEAYPLAIMDAHGEDYLTWFYNNYIQLNCHEKVVEGEDLFLAFYDDQAIKSPHLYVQFISHSALMNMGFDIREFIKKNIEQNYYLYFQVDEYYIPNRFYYKKQHLIHDLLVIGYIGDTQLIICGYDDNAKMSTCVIPTEDFIDALNNNNIDKYDNEWADKVQLIKYKHNVKYSMNLYLMKSLLEDYINATNRFEDTNRYRNRLPNTVYGVDVYAKVDEYLHLFSEKKSINQRQYLDNRIFKIIQEHKEIMCERLVYISAYFDCSAILEKYKKVLALARKNHLLAVMFNCEDNYEIIELMIDNNNLICEQDKKIFSELIDMIDENMNKYLEEE